MHSREINRDRIRSVTRKLLAYCYAHNWAGYDPYDALNSEFLNRFPILDSRIPRLFLTQLTKRSPINLRPFFHTEVTQNPKAIGLFLKALIKLLRVGLLEDQSIIGYMVQRLEALRSENPYYCWGYSFPWQSKDEYVPRGSPNLVCTAFVADALLDAYELTFDEKCLSMAKSAANYLNNELYWTEGDFSAGFSYPLPSMRTHIYNSNFLGSATLCRVFHRTGDKPLLATALRVARYSVSKQNDDGSWHYGELCRQSWIDNFHTGFNLLALRDIGKYGTTSEFDLSLRRGLAFYRAHFFRSDGAPKYYHDSVYPIDIHSVAQSIITFVELRSVDEANMHVVRSVLSWVLAHMWNDNGYFYYQVCPLYTKKISYMRWSQAWMLLALSSIIEILEN